MAASCGQACLPALLSAAGVGLLQVRQGTVVAASEAAALLLGTTTQTLVGSALRELAGAAGAQLASLHDQAQASCTDVSQSQAEWVAGRIDGASGPLRVWAVAESHDLSSGSCVFLGLAAQRGDDQAVRLGARAQASLQRVLETAPMAMALFEWPSCRLLQLNHLAEEFLGGATDTLLGRTPAQWAGALPAQQAADLQANLDLAGEFPTGVRREVEQAGVDGSTPRVWDMRLVSAGSGDGSAQGQILLVATEVTDLRAAEQERFDAAIAQRGMLVQEVHHRIKNNLQGVAGLLQQASARFPEVAPILSDAMGQLQAIAQVYGLQVGSSGPVVLAGLLKAVAAAVQKTFHHPIEVLVEGLEPERWRLPEAESIPVALTANELLTNAIKHGTSQPVICRLQAGAGDVALEIFSQGVLREGFDLSKVPSGASGLGLVRALLPRRAADFTLSQAGDQVRARVLLRPPAVRKDA